MKKSECTPEEWVAYLERMRQWRLENLTREQERQRAYSARPDVKEKRRIRDADPERRAKRLAHGQKLENKETARARQNLLKETNPEYWKARIAEQRKRRTGFTPELVAEMMVFQGGKCAVCQRDFESRQVRADHCHDTHQPRGLLCHHCNIMEGMMRGMNIEPTEFGKRLEHYRAYPPVIKSLT